MKACTTTRRIAHNASVGHRLSRQNPQHRRVAQKVNDGVVQKKNRTALSGDAYWRERTYPRLERQPPGPGHRHLLKKRDVEAFIDLLPDWDELRHGLNAVLLATSRPYADGWHRPGVVAVCAWPREIAETLPLWYVEAHRPLFDRLVVPIAHCPTPDGEEGQWFRLDWTENAAKAYQLLHILLHELGHHHDRMTTRSQVKASRGETYAEWYANTYADRIWDRYFECFDF